MMGKPSIPDIIISWGVEATSGHNDGWIMGHYRDKLLAVRDYINNLLRDPVTPTPDTCETYKPSDRQNKTFIYESPDGGQTVYRRKAGSAERELYRS